MTPVDAPPNRVLVPARHVAEQYLGAELTRITGQRSLTVHEADHIQSLPDDEFWRLVQGLSSTYRLNYVSEFLGNTGYSWYSEPRSANDLEMPKMSPDIDRITHSVDIGRNMLKFRDYLQAYFADYPRSDPYNLGQFRLIETRAPAYYKEIILKYRDGKLIVVDGNNRLMRHLLEGNDSFEAFTGYPSDEEPALKATWAEFRTLRNLWRTTDDEVTRDAILTTVRRLMYITHDGREAVEVMWVIYGRFDDVIAAGRDLLAI